MNSIHRGSTLKEFNSQHPSASYLDRLELFQLPVFKINYISTSRMSSRLTYKENTILSLNSCLTSYLANFSIQLILGAYNPTDDLVEDILILKIQFFL